VKDKVRSSGGQGGVRGMGEKKDKITGSILGLEPIEERSKRGSSLKPD